MDVIYLLIFMGAVVAVGFLIAFFISVKSGQFDDNETPAMRILFDDGVKEKGKSEDAEKKDGEEGKRE